MSRKTVLFCLACFLLAFFLSMRVFNDGVPGWKHIVTSDGRGYYAYLPAVLIDRDLTFAKTAEREGKLNGYLNYKPAYLVKSGNGTLNKYFCGEAVLLLPFFAAGAICTYVSGGAMDGYSFFFQFFTGLGTLFYLLAGLYFLWKTLENLQIRRGVITLVVIAIVFGTNLFYYTLWQPTMSHVYSFFAINGFMWYAGRAMQNWNLSTAAKSGFFLGLVCLVRPTNAVVLLLVPFLAGGYRQTAQFLRAAIAGKSALILATVIVAGLLALQCILWYLQTGRFIEWSYRNEGFNFGNPEFANVLFSFRKGLFIYTPLILLSLAGLAFLFIRSRVQFAAMLLFLAAGTYIIASWWNWYYGDGFGLRAFIDYYGVFAILLAVLLNPFSRRMAMPVMILLMAPFILLNLVQTWQYTHRVIQPNSMNAAKYRHVFMRTDSAAIDCLGGNDELPDYHIHLNRPTLRLFNDFETVRADWSPVAAVSTVNAFSGSHAGYLDSLQPFSPGIEVKASRLGNLPSTFFIRGELMVYDSLAGASNGALVVLSMDSIGAGENYWRGFKLNDTPVKRAGTWRKVSFALMLPEITRADRTLKVYIWNTKGKPMLVDDFEVQVYE